MTIVTQYISDDGKIFDNGDECYDYEKALKWNKYKDKIFFFDKNGDRLPPTEDGFSDCVWLIIQTDEAAQFMEKEFSGYVLPWDKTGEPYAGFWAYSDNCSWDSYEEFNKKVTTFEKVKKYYSY